MSVARFHPLSENTSKTLLGMKATFKFTSKVLWAGEKFSNRGSLAEGVVVVWYTFWFLF
jgi:hypothetical protein